LASHGSGNLKHSTSNRFQQNLVQVPQEVLQPVIKESIDSLLHKKERNFKVIKNAAKNRQQLMKVGSSRLS